MAEFRCPGQDTRYWKAEDIFDLKCPSCGKEMEFFKDEPMRCCPECGHEVRNPRINLGCAKWCKFAKECLGSLPEYDNTVVPVCDRLTAALKETFGVDSDQVVKALTRLEFADQMLATETADHQVVRIAALLADLEDNNVRELLEPVKIDTATAEQVCRIISAQRDGKNIPAAEFKIVSAAARLADKKLAAITAQE